MYVFYFMLESIGFQHLICHTHRCACTVHVH